VLKGTYGTHRESRAEKLPIDKKSAAGLSFLKGKPIKVLNISQESLYPWRDEESKKFTSLLTIPLKVGDKSVGVFSVYTKQERKFSRFEVELAEIFASQAALAIINRNYLNEFHRAAITEQLTGFYNAGYFHERLNEEINRAARTGHPVSLLFADLDHFKLINDSYGHLAGDKTLRDEVAIILPETDNAQAFQVAERIRKKVADASFQHNIRLTISIGIATYPQDATQPEDLLKVTDWAMYQAKQKGRNRIFSASTNTSPHIKSYN